MPSFCAAYESEWDAAARLSLVVAIQTKLTSDFTHFFSAKTVLCVTQDQQTLTFHVHVN